MTMSAPRPMLQRSLSATSSLATTRRSVSPRAFKALAHGVTGLIRAQSIADEGLPPNLDVTTMVQRIVVTLASWETFTKVARSIFDKFSVPSSSAPDDTTPDGRGRKGAWQDGAGAPHVGAAHESAAPSCTGGTGTDRVMPVSKIGDVLKHWEIPADESSIFWAVLRKRASIFDCIMLPSTIAYVDYEAVLLKVLRRVRDKYCRSSVSRVHYITRNVSKFETEYEVVDECGKGSFGECFWVKHRGARTGRNRRVCKKIPKAGAQVPTEEMAAELNALKTLDHPNILRVFEWFESADGFFIILEGAAGGDLKSMLAQAKDQGETGIQQSFVQHIAGQAMRALAYIHSMHIIHRDIKPANLLLASSQAEKVRLLLADFGVAELYDEAACMKAYIKGTLPYMPPEVFVEQVYPRSDVWAMGVVVYELISGVRPVKADKPMRMYAMLRQDNITYEHMQQAGASEQAVDFVSHCLVYDVTNRPSAKTALVHAWLHSSIAHQALPTGKQAKKIRQSLETYLRMGHFSKSAMNCIAAQLDTSCIEGLNDIFFALDTDHDGRLSCAELACGLAELGVDPDSIGHLVDAIDMNNDGVIQYSEFVACLLQTQSKLVEDVLFHAFHLVDVNHDGNISVDELKSMIGKDGPLNGVLPDGKTVEQVLREVDRSNDHKISFEEFRDYLMQEQMTKSPELQPQAQDPLEKVLRHLAASVGRSEEELAAQAKRLSEVHWLSTVADLRDLRDEDWPRLGLPLKLERALRNLILAP